MSGLDTLIRLHQQHLDVKRVFRTTIESHRIGLEQRAYAIQQEVEDEKLHAAKSLEARQTYPAYAERMRTALRALADEMIEADTEIARLNDEIAEAFQTLKSYELARDTREKKLANEQALRERNELDAIGAVQHRRQEVSYTKER